MNPACLGHAYGMPAERPCHADGTRLTFMRRACGVPIARKVHAHCKPTAFFLRLHVRTYNTPLALLNLPFASALQSYVVPTARLWRAYGAPMIVPRRAGNIHAGFL